MEKKRLVCPNLTLFTKKSKFTPTSFLDFTIPRVWSHYFTGDLYRFNDTGEFHNSSCGDQLIEKRMFRDR